MTRAVEKWWVLRKLQKTSLRHTIEVLSDKDIMAGMRTHDWKDEFIHWIATESLRRWRFKIKLWWEREEIKKAALRARLLKTRMDYYNSILLSCVKSGLIETINDKDPKNGNTRTHLHASALGDDFVADFWYKRTIGHPISTAIIIAVIGGVLIWYATYRFERLFGAEQDQIQQIQIIPYE